MAIENLTDAAIRAAKPQAKLYHLHDGGGLYLAITPNGAKSWRMVYRFGGRQRRLVLGRYPALGLSDAREKWREARKTLANGLDPSNEKRRIDRERAEAAANTFKKFADELIEKRERESASPAVLKRMRRLMSLARALHDMPLDKEMLQDVIKRKL